MITEKELRELLEFNQLANALIDKEVYGWHQAYADAMVRLQLKVASLGGVAWRARMPSDKAEVIQTS